MTECIQEPRIRDVEKSTAVNGAHIENISKSIQTQQRWIVGFIISVLLLVYGTAFKDFWETKSVMANTVRQEENLEWQPNLP